MYILNFTSNEHLITLPIIGTGTQITEMVSYVHSNDLLHRHSSEHTMVSKIEVFGGNIEERKGYCEEVRWI